MKKILFFLFILSSCTLDNTNKNSNSLDSINVPDINKKIIKFDEIFTLFGDYFCYFYLEDCGSCKSLENKIYEIVLTMNNFYLVEPNYDIPRGIDKKLNIGVSDISEFRITGYPTLIYINDNCISEIYVGIQEISYKLF